MTEDVSHIGGGVRRRLKLAIEDWADSGLEEIPYFKSQKVAPSAVFATFEDWQQSVSACTACALSTSRNQVVLGEGDGNSDLMFIADHPLSLEDQTGRPLLGPAGELLTKIIAAMNLSRESVYITYAVKCFPGPMSAPLESVKACRRHLFDEVERVKPRAIVVLGSSAYSMLGDLPPFEVARGKLMQLHDVPCMPTHHPAALLRKPALKAEAWKDLQAVQKLLS